MIVVAIIRPYKYALPLENDMFSKIEYGFLKHAGDVNNEQ